MPKNWTLKKGQPSLAEASGSWPFVFFIFLNELWLMDSWRTKKKAPPRSWLKARIEMGLFEWVMADGKLWNQKKAPPRSWLKARIEMGLFNQNSTFLRYLSASLCRKKLCLTLPGVNYVEVACNETPPTVPSLFLVIVRSFLSFFKFFLGSWHAWKR